MPAYKVLTQQVFQKDGYILVPIRAEDRYDIMRWRNEQIYHLRQARPLSSEDQDQYFAEVITPLFDQEQPQQLLFSLLQEEQCIGYGGLVHINWLDRNAEISFVMATDLEQTDFARLWTTFLALLETVAFAEAGLRKLSTYAYDLRPHLYPVLEQSGYRKEAVLREHVYFDLEFVDVVIHSKIVTGYGR